MASERVLCPVLVGRGPELALLGERARKAAEGAGGAVLITGDAGIGTGRLRLFAAVLSLFRQLGGRSPLLLVIEDLQWADPSSRELFDYLARLVRPLRLLLVGTCRPEDLGRNHPLRQLIRGWEKSRQVELLQLEPLDAGETRAMVRATVGAE